MGVMNFGDIRHYVRGKVLDLDEMNYGLDEEQLGLEVNAAYSDYMAKVDKAVGLLHTLTSTGAKEYAVAPTPPYPRDIILAEVDGVGIERMEVAELRSIIEGRLAVTGIPATGTPKYWALYQVYGTPVSYNLYLYPDVVASPATVTLWGGRNPVLMAEDDDVPAVTEQEAFWIGLVAAVRVATLLGRAAQAGFIEGLIRDLPDDIVMALGMQQQFVRPRIRKDEEPV